MEGEEGLCCLSYLIAAQPKSPSGSHNTFCFVCWNVSEVDACWKGPPPSGSIKFVRFNKDYSS